jgi:glycerol-3-phosphate dehydrogenase (NAD(P)+)
VLSKFSGHLARTVPVIGLAKGIEVETFLRPSEICQATCGVVRHAVISGPSHAEEVARRRPTSVVAASDQVELASQLQQLLSDEVFRVYSHDDLIGVELAGALKNIIGIAGGICDGLELGDNAKAALLTRGIVEISRFGMALGSRRETFSGLAGVGDLITTCFSRHGRNRHVGELLGRGQDLAQVLASMEMIAEGIPTTQAVLPRARLLGIDMPITEAVYRVLFEGLDARAAIRQVMERDRKEEHDRV